MYIILIQNKQDRSDRYFCKRFSLEEAKECAREYISAPDNKWYVEIYEANQVY
jgi:hypothetical protein